MATWQQFAESAPDLAAPVRARLTATKHHVLATLRKDGTPRVSGTEVDFTPEGHLHLGSMADAQKGKDLKRDPRFALHANPGDGSMDGGDAKLSGRATPLPTEGPDDAFDLDLHEVVLTTVENDQLVIRLWTPENGLREIRRK
ncbi:pyridoxamine 5'-phosphate oxidase-related FMN- binding [Catenulispora acidiphila DSM 44928]|uniref:Pyridoxamine 5'-phosphate oxidase-related FMN-binding n=1 Tax=Catenulispora acidiphila (strain DSM 44928 / JCM 14897 / NBRC 102108 / NRRL B-24433 / ID139908) TaxID=479433 RepID=C7PYZ3_CATAD|nr:pyridoxamine 5'-phosphate oxidase family protein [Catenulispora acidiphila]ACU69549.1 pyridoxamine 5'-phosphate oxidase-related FMN- binding [Catenulispora acidiphila DSM 44928]